MKDKNSIVFFLATGCGIGLVPFAPGTVGSLAALLPCWLLSLFPLSVSVIFLITFIVAATWISESAEKFSGKKDHGSIVIDEFAGMMVTMIGISFNLKTAAAAFILFRFFDIMKPFPINIIDKTLPGGAGIVLDDVAAGIAAHIALRLLLLTPLIR